MSDNVVDIRYKLNQYVYPHIKGEMIKDSISLDYDGDKAVVTIMLLDDSVDNIQLLNRIECGYSFSFGISYGESDVVNTIWESAYADIVKIKSNLDEKAEVSILIKEI